jgi:hypothetical protein
MHLFMAREAVDKHLEIAGDLIDPKKSAGDKLKALLRAAAFYAVWYPTRWLGFAFWPKYGKYGQLATHLRFIERTARRLARQTFHGMLVHQAKLERKQGFLFRIVDIGMELFAMAATVSLAHARLTSGNPEGKRAVELADVRCRAGRRLIEQWFAGLWGNDDDEKNAITRQLVAGDYRFLEQLTAVEQGRRESGARGQGGGPADVAAE